MSSPAATTPMRLTGTQLAQFFRFRCERKLRWELAPAGDAPPQHVRPGMGLLGAAGKAFERRKTAALARRFGPDAVRVAGFTPAGDARPLDFAAVLETLCDPGPVKFLVQPRLEIPDPEAFAARWGIDPALPLDFAAAQPDLVRIGRWPDGRLRLGVIDVKLSRERAVHHFAQVAFYTMVLEEIVRATGVDARVDTRWGWVWNRGSRAPRRFALAAYRHHVGRFLREELPRIAALRAEEAAWHLSPACAGCGFFQHCRAEADATDDVSRVPGITPLARQVLRGRGITTVKQLNLRGIRGDTYTGCHALESAESSLKKRAQALSYRKLVEQEKQTHLLGGGERVRVVLSAEGDPVSGTVFALGFRAERAGARPQADVVVSREGSARGEGEMLRGFLARLRDTAVAMLGTGNGGGRAEKALHVFVYDRQELELLRGVLHRHMSDPAAQPGIAALAGLVFPSTAGASAGLRAAAAAPGTVVVDAVSELFALPVAYALDLAAVSAALKPAERAHAWHPRADYGWPLSSQVAFERIHNVWRARPHATERGEETGDEVRAEIERTVAAKLDAVDSVVRGVREQASRARVPRMRMEGGGPAPATSATPIPDATLEALRIFTELEAAAEALSIRALHTLPSRDRARRFECITGLEPVERVSDREWVFEFDPECREAKFRPGEFALVLTNDNGEMLAETDRKPWLRRKLMVELAAYDLAHDPPRVTLASDYGFERLKKEGLLKFDFRCVLDRAEADFNTRRVVSTLRHLADGHGEARFVRGLLDGAISPEWLLAPLDADAGWAETVARAGRPVLNAEQEAAWRAAFERAVTVIWGPPGTGKTYLLAWTLLGLAASARAAGKPLRILVSAATHRAIANVLVRVARELIPSPLRLVKLEGRGSEADREAGDAGVELVSDERLEAVLAESDETALPVVVGSTVWSLWKRMRAASNDAADEDAGADVPVSPMFDVVVIDEASQMKVADALIALSSIRRGGRVIVCGDDRQLAPIVRGSYDDAETLFGSAFAHFAARFGRLALRESRRMNAALVGYPRRIFYPGLVSMVPERRLLTAPESVDLADPIDRLLWEMVFDARDSVVFLTYADFRGTARNPFEARLAARIATLARAGLRDPATGAAYDADGFREQALAILSPHRAQNSAILHELATLGWAYGELPVVDTVERMQGNEREMIVVSYAVADREYAEREAEFLLDPHRFNVSITRPRAKLVVLMSDEVLRALPRDERVMTESMAIKGYLRQPWRRVRHLELPAPDGTPVRVTVRVR
ncbi:bifunctional RecB family nuclease/DEAD/DEAH box helicase [Longimicrobium sp.]|uniref:bifunctional RecB family nuclease/DEAD/DEAH box helicase n=1 Tax=Longimicrobium sp. TaxID=2029185 RepID=UPI002CE50A65|nr:AAA domain-containing protein [Longimicrobium sp.]HSU13923.1 AAA domain-containing protein [Longimicrobium sp.]